MFNSLWAVGTRARDFILAAVRNMSEEERRTLALTLIDKKLGWVVAHNLTLFTNLGEVVAKRLVAADGDLAGQVFRNIAAFGLNDDQKRLIMHLCIDRGQGWAIQHAIRELPLDSGFARMLIASGHEAIVGEHLALFKGYSEQQFHKDRFAWQMSFDLRRAPGHRYKA